MEDKSVYFEDLDYVTQEVVIDLVVSIIENKMQGRGKEPEDETSSNLREIEQRPPQCIM